MNVKRNSMVKTRLGDGVVRNMEISDVNLDDCIYTIDFDQANDHPGATVRYGVRVCHLNILRYFRADELN